MPPILKSVSVSVENISRTHRTHSSSNSESTRARTSTAMSNEAKVEAQGKAPNVLIVYYSMYKHIETMAAAVAKGVEAGGGKVYVFVDRLDFFFFCVGYFLSTFRYLFFCLSCGCIQKIIEKVSIMRAPETLSAEVLKKMGAPPKNEEHKVLQEFQFCRN